MDGVTILGTNELTHARWKEGDRDRASMACAYTYASSENCVREGKTVFPAWQ